MIQPLSAFSAISGSDERNIFYVFPGHSGRPFHHNALGHIKCAPWQVAGTGSGKGWQELAIELTHSPTELSQASLVFDVLKDEVATGQTLTFAGTEKTRKVCVASAVTADGTTNKFSLRITPASIPRTPWGLDWGFYHAITFVSDSAYESGYSALGYDGPNSVEGDWYNHVFRPCDDWRSSEYEAMGVVGPPGVINGYRIALSTLVTNYADSQTFVIELDGVLQDGSGGTVDTRLVLTGNEGTASFSLSVTTGQTIRLKTTTQNPINPGAGVNALSIGVSFTATQAHRFYFGGWDSGTGQFGDTPTTDYAKLDANNSAHLWQSTFTLSAPDDENFGTALKWINGRSVRGFGLVVFQAGAPGASATRTFDVWKNDAAVTGGPSVEFSGGAAAQVETSSDGSVGWELDDLIGMRTVTASGPVGDGSNSAWEFALGATADLADAEAEVGVIGPLVWVEWPRVVPGSPA